MRGDLQSERTRYGPKKIYARTKREQVVLTQQWARRLQADRVFVHAMHPGWADTKGVPLWMPVFRPNARGDGCHDGATVYLAPDRPARVTGRAVATNYQGTVEWAP